MEDMPEDLRDFVMLTPEERINMCIKDVVNEYQREGIISGGSRELAEIKKLKGKILNEEKDIAKQTGKEGEIVGKLLNTLPEKKKEQLLRKWQAQGTKKAIDDVLKTASKEDRINILSQYDKDSTASIVDMEESINNIRKEMAEKYPTMEKCYRLKDATDGAIFEKDENGIARIGNNVEKTQGEIGTLADYYMEHSDEIPASIVAEYGSYTKEEQVAFFITSLNNVTIQEEYKELITRHPELIKIDEENEHPSIGIEEDEISPTNDKLISEIGDELNFEENQVEQERVVEKQQSPKHRIEVGIMDEARVNAENDKSNDVTKMQAEITSGVREIDNPEKYIESDAYEK